MKRLHAVLLTAAAVSVAVLPAITLPPAADATGPCVVTAKNGPNSNCGPYHSRKIALSNGYNTYVANNGWACGPTGSDCGPQRLTAYNPSSWSVRSTQQAGNTSVLAYPDVQQLFTDTSGNPRPLRRLSTIRSQYDESMPHNNRTISQAAYDLWLDRTSGPTEVMIWVDNVNRGTGGARVLRHASFYGVRYTLLRYGGELIWSRDRNAHRGTVPIHAMLGWLVRHHFESARIAIGQIDFGWEICSTGGVAETFAVNDFGLQVKRSA